MSDSKPVRGPSSPVCLHRSAEGRGACDVTHACRKRKPRATTPGYSRGCTPPGGKPPRSRCARAPGCRSSDACSLHASRPTRAAPCSRSCCSSSLAGALGGPVAGALDSSGGFVAPGADSEVAIDRIEAATGTEPDAGVVLLVDRPTPARVDAVAAELGRIPGVAETGTGDRAGDRALVTATLRASADEDDVAQDALDAFAGRDGRHRRRRRRGRAADRRDRRRRPRPRRAARVPAAARCSRCCSSAGARR